MPTRAKSNTVSGAVMRNPFVSFIAKGVKAIQDEYKAETRKIERHRQQGIRKAATAMERRLANAQAEEAQAKLQENMYKAIKAAKDQKQRAKDARHAAGIYTVEEQITGQAKRFGRELLNTYNALAGNKPKRRR